jgi:multiple sugar transport system ATP-binding protein
VPQNVFVAGFIGSPSMNFFNATLVNEEGRLIVDSGDFRLPVPEKRKAAFSSHAGSEVVLGIRPEYIHGADFVPPNTNTAPVRATIEVIEMLGHELHLFLNTGKNSFVAIVDIRMAPTVGNVVDVVIDVDSMHLFDKKTELAIR